jgi:hypothetical protein
MVPGPRLMVITISGRVPEDSALIAGLLLAEPRRGDQQIEHTEASSSRGQQINQASTRPALACPSKRLARQIMQPARSTTNFLTDQNDRLGQRAHARKSK